MDNHNRERVSDGIDWVIDNRIDEIGETPWFCVVLRRKTYLFLFDEKRVRVKRYDQHLE